MRRTTSGMALCWAIVALLDLKQPLQAETVRMVKDLNTTPESRAPGGYVHSATLGLTFFMAEAGTTGFELWKTDGTVNGTLLVKDIRPGAASSDIGSMTDVDGTLYFTADDGVHGSELWKTDGTAAGTVLVKDIAPGADGSFPGGFFVANGITFFVADDGVHGSELWKSNGTELGTVLVKDIHPSGSAGLAFLFSQSGGLCFLADDGTHGRELWKTDGTENGTVLLKDIRSGADGIEYESEPVVLDGALYFPADDGSHGSELWKTDCTTAGTTIVKDIQPGADGSFPHQLFNGGGTLYFLANSDSGFGRSLFKSNGTEAGTIAINPTEMPTLDPFSVRFLATVNGKLIFTAYDTDFTYGHEPWWSDGTDAGTGLLKDIATGLDISDNPADSGMDIPTDLNGTLIFTALAPDSGRELWKTDGTPEGTVLVKDIRPGAGASSPQFLSLVTPVGSQSAKLVFWADTAGTGNELWASDGTAGGTALLKDLVPGHASSTPGSLGEAGGKLLFSFRDGPQYALWITDGTLAGTMKLRRFESGRTGSSSIDPQIDVAGELFFWINDTLWKSDGTEAGTNIVYGVNPSDPFNFLAALADGTLFFLSRGSTLNGRNFLWRTDGTTSGTVALKDLTGAVGEYGYPDGSASLPTEFGGSMFYVRDYDDYDTGQHHSEMWKTNGTTAGTVPVKAFDTLPSRKRIASMKSVGGNLEFIVQWFDGIEVWKSDGTESGTGLVTTVSPGSSFSPYNVNEFGGGLYFTLDDGTHGNELWKTDGTAGGTVLVKDIAPGPDGSNPNSFYKANGLLYFNASDVTSGVELWRTDGTSDGTVRLKDISQGAGDSYPRDLHAVGGTVFFSAEDGSTGRTLWRTDGTPGGTALVKDVDPGSTTEEIGSFAAAGGTLFFRHHRSDVDGFLRSELWQSDGTAGGTDLVMVLAPRNVFCFGEQAQFDGSLYFTAWDEASGCELWRTGGARGTPVKFELWPGPEPRFGGPGGFFASGESLYFTADDGIHGRELWSVSNLPPSQATPTPIGGTVVRNGTVSDGSTSTETVTVQAGARYMRVTFSLLFASRAGCSASVTIQRPGSPLLGPYELSADPETLNLRGIAGDWVFEISSSGGCSAQPYQIEVASVSPFVGSQPGSLLVGLLLLTLAGFVAHGRRRGRSPGPC